MKPVYTLSAARRQLARGRAPVMLVMSNMKLIIHTREQLKRAARLTRGQS